MPNEYFVGFVEHALNSASSEIKALVYKSKQE